MRSAATARSPAISRRHRHFALDRVLAQSQFKVGELLAFAFQRETRRLQRVALLVVVEDRDDLALLDRVASDVFHSRTHRALRCTRATSAAGDAAARFHIIAPRKRDNRGDDNRDHGGGQSILTSSRAQCFFIELGFVELALIGVEFGSEILI